MPCMLFPTAFATVPSRKTGYMPHLLGHNSSKIICVALAVTLFCCRVSKDRADEIYNAVSEFV